MNTKKTARKYLAPFFIVLVMTAASGCATTALVKYAGKEELREYRLTDADSAVINDEGNLLVCLQGWTVKTNPDRDATSFHITFPLSLFEDDSVPPPRLVSDYGATYRLYRSDFLPDFKSFQLAPEQVSKRCPKRSPDTREVPVRHVNAVFFEGIDHGAANEQVEIVYVVEIKTSETIGLVYQHPNSVFGDSPYVRIDLPPEEMVKPNQAALIALPFAVVADIVLGVVLVIACVFAGGNCV